MARVLVVDDEAPIRLLCRVNLEAEGMEVLEAGDGPTGLEAARRERPDVVLLDVMMPGPDGWRVAERLLEDSRTGEIPIIFLTERQREAAGGDAAARELAVKDANKEAAAVLGFTSAVAAYGGFFIPKSYGTSIALTGGPQGALILFVVFYLTCIALTWWYYARRNAEMPC